MSTKIGLFVIFLVLLAVSRTCMILPSNTNGNKWEHTVLSSIFYLLAFSVIMYGYFL